MSDNSQKPNNKNFFDKWMEFLKVATVTFTLLGSLAGAVGAGLVILVNNKEYVKPIIGDIVKLIEKLVLDKKVADKQPNILTVNKPDRSVEKNSKRRIRKSDSRLRKNRSNEASDRDELIVQKVLPFRTRFNVQLVLIHSFDGDQEREDVLQEFTSNDSLSVPGIELLHQVSAKTLEPDAVLNQPYKYYYQRKIRWGEQFLRLAYRSQMKQGELRAYNPKLDLTNKYSIKAGETTIILKAQAVHVVDKRDDLRSIALLYGVTEEAILIANAVEKDWIYTGKRLYIPFPQV